MNLSESQMKYIKEEFRMNNFSKCDQEKHSFLKIHKDEIVKIIRALDKTKSTGPYSVPFQILTTMINDISEILVKIFNLSIECGIFPDMLKTVKVIPIFKNKGSPFHVSNYRPISLLSNIDQIFEKVMHSRMMLFLEKNSLIYYKQFGFRPKHSTNHGLIDITETIRESIDNRAK